MATTTLRMVAAAAVAFAPFSMAVAGIVLTPLTPMYWEYGTPSDHPGL